ncbi:universal stress protein [Amphritea sp. HPY]|uniref:universal stress protein n=1 Tax=Amphritea sp. HPY TaxID=3421652 RepID=UPI003D7C75B5
MDHKDESQRVNYQKIMVPVDLVHIDHLGKALTTVADLARMYQIPVCYVGVSSALPSEIAHNPDEFANQLELFAQQQADKHGLPEVTSWAVISHDPAVDLDAKLMQTATELGADLIVMASHVPGLIEYVFSSNAGYVASHASVSVFVVR